MMEQALDPDILNLLGFDENGDILNDDSESDGDSDGSENNEVPAGYNRELRARRLQLREGFNPFNCPPAYFRKHYRMTQDLATRLLNLIREDFDIAQRTSHIPVHLEFCIGLRMFATGGYQTMVAHDHFSAVSQTVVSRVMDRFTDCLFHLADRLIRFPRTREERQEIEAGFLRYTRIPGVLGLIDGTIIKFLRPSENEEAFYNYRHKHSMNVQIISDHDFLIRNIRVCPGSNTDRNVWNHSDMKQYLEELRGNLDILINECPHYLVGDNEYSPSPIMLTPIRNAVPRSPQALYTREICTTRSRQERLNEKLVNKWRILKRERAMRYTPIKVARIIVGSVVLHNYIILDGNIDEEIVDEEVLIQDMNIAFDNAAGERERGYIVRRYFTV